MNKVSVWANMTFRRMDEGGLKLSFCPYDFFTGDQLQIGYPMEIDGCYYDCRLFMPPRFVELGKSYCMAIRFLSLDLALPRLSVGKRFTLWQGRTIADGIVVRMDDSGSAITRKERFESPDFYLSAVRHGDCCKPKACSASAIIAAGILALAGCKDNVQQINGRRVCIIFMERGDGIILTQSATTQPLNHLTLNFKL